ncbi:multicopper oxidase [Azorhizobium oxalatiphilum]|uniref:Multicopper oxidase n=1 Tax=Azorhizobium oxalatiphilum TaxID=980631 RepID=A0A917F7P8_9HYPH|nr:multicopper oxidase family protein [Azorhizobium oxalatiphilum]GGF56149.1 multicopper oxidase [Azorhizobium oxalatiphilum]
MRVPVPSRRAVLTGAAALVLGGALPRLALSQNTPAVPTPAGRLLKVGTADRIELAGSDPVSLFDGALPGPILRVKRGQPLSVAVANGLSGPLDITWHGVRLPNALDGVPGLTGPAIAAGETRDIRFAPPDAGTFWYHAFDGVLTRRALAGALIVEEETPAAFGADHVMLLQTWGVDATTQMPVITVNGAVSPTLEAPAASRARLRLINASPEFLPLRVAETQSWVMAIDGQPVTPFVLKDGRMQLVPGGRIDLAMDINLNGASANPINVQVELLRGPIELALIAPVGGSNTPAPASTPQALPANPLPSDIPLQGAVRAELAIGVAPADLARIPVLSTVPVGKSLVFALNNTSEVPVAVHFHGMPVRLLDGADDGWKPWWHDTVPVPAKRTVRVAVRPDTPGKWAIIARAAGTGEAVAAAAYEVK